MLASTAKIVTSLAALDLLGPQYRWRTHAYATGPVYLGRLQGDLIIAGGGNARLSSAELLGWMRRMREQGLAEIGGDILIDRSAFALTDEDHRHTPVPGAGRPHHVWPGALTLDEGVLQVLLEAGGELLPNACGACAGYGAHTFAPDTTAISTTARNFTGRMGAASSRVFLGSPYTVAASAITGRIADPRELMA